jgi:regulator of nucleoside diphosphate kinase
MRDDTPCHLTAKDVSVLEGMTDRIEAQARPAMMRLLQRKLASARVFIRDDIDPRVATINSRIQYLVGDGPVETCVLTHGGENALPGTALPVSDLHGLALLGLMEGDAIAVEIEGGRTDVLHVVRIEHQPEAARQESRHPGFAVTAGASTARRESGLLPAEPDDDDPGPRAA